MPETKRQTELDILRLFALWAVILMHAGGNPYLSPNFNANHHSMFVAALVWCVPAFLMISGRFFLDPERSITIRKLWKKYLPHIAIVFLTWTTIYTLYYVKSGGYDNLSIWGILTQWVEGPYHFWYLYATIGLYALTPILRKITADDTVMAYFLVLYALANLVLEYLVYLPKTGGIVETAFGKLWLGIFTGYVGYYVLGYFLFHHRNPISEKLEMTVYLVGALSLAVTIILEGQISPELQEADFVKQYLKPNVILFSSALYLFFVRRVSQIRFSGKFVFVLQKLTEWSFGVYILHALVNELLAFFPIPQPVAHPYLVQFLLTAVIYVVCLVATWLIRKIPYVGKKIT